MNTTPDETQLALWLDDELRGEELARVEAWAATQPDQLAARDEVRKLRALIASEIPAEVEPPYPDFFNSRIQKAIREAEPAAVAAAPAGGTSFWRSWLMPATAFAGMVIAFQIGQSSADNRAAATPAAIADPVVYAPKTGVDAEWVTSSGSDTGVIVLTGVAAIPDSTDFTETVFYKAQDPSSSMVDAEKPGRAKTTTQ